MYCIFILVWNNAIFFYFFKLYERLIERVVKKIKYFFLKSILVNYNSKL